MAASRRSPSDTPLMRQFLQVKGEQPDGILFFRMGDFYEMFFEDAVVAAKALDLTLTSRDKGKPDAVPMCGLPHHAARGYIARLTEQGFKVVICEQVEDPKTAKGLVKREVVQIVTPGVVVDDEVLDPKTARYLASVRCVPKSPRWGLAYVDVSTGEFRATELDSLAELAAELTRVAPREILVGHKELTTGPIKRLADRFRNAAYTGVVRRSEQEVPVVLQSALAGDMEELGLAALPLAASAAADVLQYARETQPTGTLPVSRLQVYQNGQTVVLDEAAVANLELTQTLVGGKKAGSLLAILDQTKTATGGRMLRRWLLYPLLDLEKIRARHDAVEFLVSHASLREELRDCLKEMYDIERLAGRLSLSVANPRDLGRLRWSLERLPELAKLLGRGGKGKKASAVPSELELDAALLQSLKAVTKKLLDTLVEEPPLLTKDGGMIRDGLCAVIDENRKLATGGKDAILAIEQREREATGISKLRVKYNRVFGYYIEVSRGSISQVPDSYVRKQTVANAERYVTSELAELETKILSAQDALVTRENELFKKLCEQTSESLDAILKAGQQIACIDALASLAEVAHNSSYVRPEVDESEILDLVDARHPVVERMVGEGEFVPNSCRVDTNESQLLLITGPNMAGKSTYMRQVAHIVLMAQMGGFVPAASARIGLVDRVFTRVGAADNLARGESTFMVEMRETASILAGATKRSLVVLDEVGRGTSTFDGVSIAWAVSEYLHDAIGARTLFATHYHELTRLADLRPRVKNFSVAVSEVGGRIVFLRQVVPGGASRSYGIDVARLAGLPRSVISRSRQILAELERGHLHGETSQMSLFSAVAAQTAPEPDVDTVALCKRLDSIDPLEVTPMQALALLAELKELANTAQ